MRDHHSSPSTVRFTADCVECGEVPTEPDDVVLCVRDEAPGASYRFTCATCGQPREVATDGPTSELLQGLGAKLVAPAHQPDEEVSRQP